jgi:sn-glycerol 3-phosphate transport system permease protein
VSRRRWRAHLGLSLGALCFMLPVWLIFAASTLPAGAIARGEISLVPRLAGLGVYEELLLGDGGGGTSVRRMLLVSLAMAICVAGGKIVLSLLTAFAVAFFRFPGRMAMFWLILLTLMLPIEVRIVPTYAVVADLGLIGGFGGLVLPLLASATATLMFRQMFVIVPDALIDAAQIDGAGPMRFLWHVLIPISLPNIVALLVILFVYGWNQYLWPLLAATDPSAETVMVGIVRMISPDAVSQWHRVFALTMIALLPPAVVVLGIQRWFIEGLTDVER